MDENLVIIGLGTNLGDRRKMLDAAVRQLCPKIKPFEFSHIYETPPWGFIDQPPFLNQVIKAQTNLSPQSTLNELKNIEKTIGRTPNFRYGPRLIDLDILFYNDEIINTDTLTIPHPELINRGFVLIPLLEIAQDFIHPVVNKSIKDIAKNINREGIHKLKETEV